MQTSLNGHITVNNQQIAIARDSDFRDLLDFADTSTKQYTLLALKSLCASMGDGRSPAQELYRQRLHEMRVHLRVH